jgi:hypothetical protein
MIPDPPILLTPWTPWPHRNLVKNAHLPGVYLLAQRDAAPPPHVDPLSQDIIYIGETTEGSLTRRWQQFHRIAYPSNPGASQYQEGINISIHGLIIVALSPSFTSFSFP